MKLFTSVNVLVLMNNFFELLLFEDVFECDLEAGLVSTLFDVVDGTQSTQELKSILRRSVAQGLSPWILLGVALT